MLGRVLLVVLLVVAGHLADSEAVLCWRPQKTVMVINSGRDFSSLLADTANSTFIHSLISDGALFTDVTGTCCDHSSQQFGTMRNYVRLFSGDNQDLPHGTITQAPRTPWTTDNLFTQLAARGSSFTGFSEHLPFAGYSSDVPVGTSPNQFRPDRCAWSNLFFANVAASANQPFEAFQNVTDFASELPSVSFVLPSACHDQSGGCSDAEGDDWLRDNFQPFIDWAKHNNGLFVLIYDQASNTATTGANHIPLIMVGEAVRPSSTVTDKIDHYRLNRLFLDLFQITPTYRYNSFAPSFPSSHWLALPGLAPPRARLPAPDHIVITIMENTDYDQLHQQGYAFINELEARGTLFTRSYAVAHPSQPNYHELFAGDNLGIFNSDKQPMFPADTPNLAHTLHSAGLTFGGYSELQPSVGYTGMDAGNSPHTYAYRHNPWSNFPAESFPTAWNMPFSSYAALRDAGNFEDLPTVAIVVPETCHDDHDCKLSVGDRWLRDNMQSYVDWAQTHNSLFVLTWDEDSNNYPSGNHIYTAFSGEMVKQGYQSDTHIDHHAILRMILDMHQLEHFRPRLQLTCPFPQDVFLESSISTSTFTSSSPPTTTPPTTTTTTTTPSPTTTSTTTPSPPTTTTIPPTTTRTTTTTTTTVTLHGGSNGADVFAAFGLIALNIIPILLFMVWIVVYPSI